MVKERLVYTSDDYPRLKVFERNFDKIKEEFFSLDIPMTDVVNDSYNVVADKYQMLKEAYDYVQKNGIMGWAKRNEDGLTKGESYTVVNVDFSPFNDEYFIEELNRWCRSVCFETYIPYKEWKELVEINND